MLKLCPTAEQHGYCKVSQIPIQEQGSGVEVGKPRGGKALDPSDTGHNKQQKQEKDDDTRRSRAGITDRDQEEMVNAGK